LAGKRHMYCRTIAEQLTCNGGQHACKVVEPHTAWQDCMAVCHNACIHIRAQLGAWGPVSSGAYPSAAFTHVLIVSNYNQVKPWKCGLLKPGASMCAQTYKQPSSSCPSQQSLACDLEIIQVIQNQDS